MSDTIYLTPALLAAVNAISEAGHVVSVRPGGGGNSHTRTLIGIGVKHPKEKAAIKYLRVGYTSSYTGKFQEFFGVSEEFGDLTLYSQNSILPFLGVIAENSEHWLAEYLLILQGKV